MSQETTFTSEPYWLLHHGQLLEWTTEPVENRVEYIKTRKPVHEITTRLKWLRPVKNPKRLPVSVLQACTDHAKAYADYNKVFADFDKACTDYNKACADYAKVYADFDKARADYNKAYANFDKAHADFDKACADYNKVYADRTNYNKAYVDLDNARTNYNKAYVDRAAGDAEAVYAALG